MVDKIKIEWIDVIWNLIIGCFVVFFGCINCYVMWFVGIWLKYIFLCVGLMRESKVGFVWNGMVLFNEFVFLQFLKWKCLCMIFVCVYGDFFVENVLDVWIDKVFVVMVLVLQYMFQVLMKCLEWMWVYCDGFYECWEYMGDLMVEIGSEDCEGWYVLEVYGGCSWVGMMILLLNVWFGVFVEDQKCVDECILEFFKIFVVVRFVSVELLLGVIDFNSVFGGILWIGG